MVFIVFLRHLAGIENEKKCLKSYHQLSRKKAAVRCFGPRCDLNDTLIRR